MKKIVLSLAVVALSIGAANAQKNEKPKKDFKKGFYKDKKRGGFQNNIDGLNLTDAQKTQFKSANADYKKEVAALRKEHFEKVQAIYTPEQKAILKANQEKRKAQMKERAEKRNTDMKNRLGLTDEQSAKLQANRKAGAEKIKAVRENKSLSKEQKNEQIKNIMQEQREVTSSILTPEQLAKMKGDKKQKGKRKGKGDRGKWNRNK